MAEGCSYLGGGCHRAGLLLTIHRSCLRQFLRLTCPASIRCVTIFKALLEGSSASGRLKAHRKERSTTD